MTVFKLRNLLLLLALLLAGAMAIVVAVRYRPPVDVVEVAKSLPAGVDVALQEINYTHSEGGVARWRLVARQVERRANEQVTLLEGLQLTFNDAGGVEQGTLKALRGRVNADFSEVEVHDQVEIVSHSGYTLQTDHLTYRQQDRSLRTDAPVLLTAEGLRVEGVGMHLDVDTRRLQLSAKVRAVMNPERIKREKR